MIQRLKALWLRIKAFFIEAPAVPVKPAPAPAKPPSALTSLILAQNNKIAYIDGVFANPIKGAVIHKIDEATAEQVGLAIQQMADGYKLPLSFVLGGLFIEGCFDPKCQNGNLGPGESNTANDPLGYDMGIAQLKLRYLIGLYGLKTADEARAFALDFNKAISHYCKTMAGYVADAKTTPGLSGNYTNPYYEATCRYNFGATGLQKLQEQNHFAPLPHGKDVVDLERAFAKTLGLTSIFEDLPA
jgi:hypothetical protein